MGTAARPSGPSGALHPSGAGSLMGSALEGLRLHARKSCPASLLDRESAKKFALCAQIGPNSALLCVPGEYFRGRAAGGAVLGEFFRAKRPCAGLGGDAAHFRLAAMGVLHYMTPFCGVSSACRTPVSCNSPRLVTARPLFEVVWRPNRRPPR